jgi:hypothetical protein
MCFKRRGGSSPPFPTTQKVVNESLGGADSFSSGKILRQVEGGAIKGNIGRSDSCRAEEADRGEKNKGSLTKGIAGPLCRDGSTIYIYRL